MRAWGWRGWLALAGVCLPVLPLLGLIAANLDPPPTLFADGPADGWRGLLRRPGGELGPLPMTLALALVVGALALPLGTWLAWAERRAASRAVRWLGFATLIPLAIPSYVLAGSVRSALSPGGWLVSLLHLEPSDSFTGFWAACLVLLLATVPYVQLLVGAALSRVPADAEEAARTLGAGAWRCFRVAVFPRLRTPLALSLLLVQLYVISDFGAVAVLDCQVLTWRLYQAVAETARYDLALSLGLGVLLLTVPLFLAARWLEGSAPAVDAHLAANPRPPARVDLGAAHRTGVLLAQAGVVAFGALIPLLTLGGWIADGLQRDLPFASLGEPLLHTAGIACLGATLTVACALFPAWAAARLPGWRGWLVGQLAYLTSALPGVLLAFGLLMLALALSRLTPDGSRAYRLLLDSGALLLIGYVIRFLAEGFAGLKTAVSSLDPRQDACARALGASPAKRALRVTLPQLAPGLSVAWALVFLNVVKELPVTLLLGGPAGLRTLSFRMYDRYQEALLHDAGAAGMCLVLLACVGFGLTVWGRRHA